jgi:hypothetical protein
LVLSVPKTNIAAVSLVLSVPKTQHGLSLGPARPVREASGSRPATGGSGKGTT